MTKDESVKSMNKQTTGNLDHKIPLLLETVSSTDTLLEMLEVTYLKITLCMETLMNMISNIGKSCPLFSRTVNQCKTHACMHRMTSEL